MGQVKEQSDEVASARALLAALAAAAIGLAIWMRDGAFDPVALAAIGLSFLALVLAALGPRALERSRAAATPLLTLLVLAQMAAQFLRPPGLDLRRTPDGPWPFWGGVALAIALTLAGLLPRPPLGRARFPLLLAVHAALGLWLLRASPSPEIDVFLFHRAGFSALLDGHSPYATSIPLLYGDARFYGAGLVSDGVVHVGHPYPPFSFALTFLAQFLCGDYRFAMLAALTLSGACIARLSRGRWGELCALLLLFSPRAFFVLEQGWTEPLVAAFALGAVVSVLRAPRLSTWLLGGLVAVKQYGCFALPLLPLLFPEERAAQLGRRALLACAFAVAVSLPLALAAPRPFIDSVLLFQLRQPFRFDALSFSAALARAGGPELPGWISFALLAPALVLGARLAPKGAGGFLAALALAFAAFFDAGKQAFANYHFLVLALAAGAAAALAPSEKERAAGAFPH